jgi:hypothetical protein
MPDVEQYDALVLGTGEAGVPDEQERNPVSEGRLLECRFAAQSFSSL